MKKILVSEIINSNIAVATDSGELVFDKISTLLDKNELIELSFFGISIITTAFLNAAIGQLYSKNYESNFLNEHLKLKDIQEEDIPLFKMVVERAKEYFSNKENFEQLSDDFFDEK